MLSGCFLEWRQCHILARINPGCLVVVKLLSLQVHHFQELCPNVELLCKYYLQHGILLMISISDT
uniref:Uncharacterized protein n=1 Tax=Arundo donax TaxID=35708 RepID=A0A0A8ZIC7_ARUDO